MVIENGGPKDCLSVLDLDRLREAPLNRDPFDFVVVEQFLCASGLPSILADFPDIRRHGSFPVEGLDYGPSFAHLVAALTGPALRNAIEEKFGIDLSERPTLLTVRGRSDGKDGRIHTDFQNKAHHSTALLEPGVGSCRGPVAFASRAGEISMIMRKR